MSTDIAVVGLACNFPKTPNIQAYWDLLINGQEGIDQNINDNQKGWVNAKGVLTNAENFDADFFDISYRDARLLDPQHRQLLMLCYQALYDANLIDHHQKLRMGLYASGSPLNSYYEEYIAKYKDDLSTAEKYDFKVKTMVDTLATFVANKLGLTGSVMSIQTACSSSLVAIHAACQSLMTFENDVMLVGAATVTYPLLQGYEYIPDMILSPDGHCRPFDECASGTVKSDGVGAVVLMRLDDAIKYKHQIYAVIKGSAINNDAGKKVSFTAPSYEGQLAVLKDALSFAEVKAEKIHYIECHGTGTKLGDAIELDVLQNIYGNCHSQAEPVAIGSVKANIGHLDVTSGLAGFIKLVLIAYYKIIPPQINFNKPSEFLRNAALYPITKKELLNQNERYHFAISSFGVGGTNCHLILSTYEGPNSKEKDSIKLPIQFHGKKYNIEQKYVKSSVVNDLPPMFVPQWEVITTIENIDANKLVVIADKNVQSLLKPNINSYDYLFTLKEVVSQNELFWSASKNWQIVYHLPNMQNFDYGYIQKIRAFIVYLSQLYNKNIDIKFMGESIFRVSSHDKINVNLSCLRALVTSMNVEYNHIVASMIDLGGDLKKLASISLLKSSKQDYWLAYRHNQLYALKLDKLPKPELAKKKFLKQNGIYIVIGGLGGIGSHIAAWLLQKYHAQVIIISQHAGHKTLYDLVAKTNEKQYKTIADHVDQVHFIQASIVDHAAIEFIANSLKEQYGQINGLFHAAGIADGSLINAIDVQQSEQVLKVKIDGVNILYKYFNTMTDFMVLCSSDVVFNVTVGQLSYSIANAYLDAFAEAFSTSHCHLLSVNWGRWAQTGMAKISQNMLINQEIVLQKNEDWELAEHLINDVSILPGTVFVNLLVDSLSAYGTSLNIESMFFKKKMVIKQSEINFNLQVLVAGEDVFQVEFNRNDDCLAKAQVKCFAHKPVLSLSLVAYRQLINNLQPVDSFSMEHHGIKFGPHWGLVTAAWFGKNEGMVKITLPAVYAEERDAYAMHPAMLDIALGFMLVHEQQWYIPYAYEDMMLVKAMRGVRTCYSYAKEIEGSENSQTKIYHILVFDDKGELLFQCDKFILRRYSEN